MTAAQKLAYWRHRIRVRLARLTSWEAKYRYWKARHKRLRKRSAPKPARAEAARMVRHYADLIDSTADLLERARRGEKRAEKEQADDVGRMSANFHADEFATHDGTPVPKSSYSGLRNLCTNYLEPMRERFGPCDVTSGYRHRAYNARIGGASQSFHIYELRDSEVAADVTFAHGSVADWADEARDLANKLDRGGVGEYPRSGFVHIDNGPRRNWWG